MYSLKFESQIDFKNLLSLLPYILIFQTWLRWSGVKKKFFLRLLFRKSQDHTHFSIPCLTESVRLPQQRLYLAPLPKTT